MKNFTIRLVIGFMLAISGSAVLGWLLPDIPIKYANVAIGVVWGIIAMLAALHSFKGVK